ncbi:cyclic-phosphate processing receiver domain-containing protein [Singulisphaera sp. PoT]|uniref:cyclic-phosphate processing receiver domain-containing protein n=1 Tax=Singulisphaera sp. PoT TaxID=3411797 RepID=UPI003BF46E76
MSSPSEPTAAGQPGLAPQVRRILFLDDDHERAHAFLNMNPEAIWVETVEDCLVQLENKWDEVHLDHDLGGERYVDFAREDCGMQIVRWLSLFPRPHLKPTKFYVHSHNPNAARMMVDQMEGAGFYVEGRSFGSAVPWYRSQPLEARSETVVDKVVKGIASFLNKLGGGDSR